MERQLEKVTRPSTTFDPENKKPILEKGAQLVKSLGEALRAFDEDEEFLFVPDKSSEYLLRNALLLIDAGELGLARNVLGNILKKNPNDVEAIRWMGWCFKNDGDLDNSLICYRQLIERRATDQDLFELGEIYYNLKKDDEALKVWIEALSECQSESPHLFDLHKNLGNVFMRLGDFESAEENYSKAMVLRPQSDVLHVNFGSLRLQQKNNKSAMEYYKMAIELNAYNDRAWCGVALVAREMNDCDWSLAVLLRALDLNPYNQTALQILMGWAQADGGTFDEAIVRTNRYLEKNQDDSDTIYSLAGLFFLQGSLHEAENELIKLDALYADGENGEKMRRVEEMRFLIKKRKETTHVK